MKQLGLFERRYPREPGYAPNDTSHRATREVKAVATGLRFAVLGVLKTRPMTADETAAALNQSVLTIRPRLTELLRMGVIEDSGERRRNESGKLAKVWKVKG